MIRSCYDNPRHRNYVQAGYGRFPGLPPVGAAQNFIQHGSCRTYGSQPPAVEGLVHDDHTNFVADVEQNGGGRVVGDANSVDARFLELGELTTAGGGVLGGTQSRGLRGLVEQGLGGMGAT